MDERMIIHDFIMNESSDITSSDIMKLDESGRLDMVDRVMDKVFTNMVYKYRKIDFGDIPTTKGDFIKFKHFKTMQRCLEQLTDINEATDGKLPEVEMINEAVKNILDYKKEFQKGFTNNNSVIVMTYNSMCLACFDATTLLISSFINFIKNGDSYEVIISRVANSREVLLIKNLVKFNVSVADGSFDKLFAAMDEKATTDTIKESGSIVVAGTKLIGELVGKTVLGKVGLSVSAIIFVIKIFVPLIKQLVYWGYSFRQNVADGAKRQGAFLEIGIEKLKNDNMNDVDENGVVKRNKVIARQEKWVKFLTSISEKFTVRFEKADKDAKQELTQDKVVIDDVAF